MKLATVFFAGLSLAYVGMSSTHADTINVPGDHALIQDAIDASSDGDVIQIAAGIYNEHSINPNGKAITIQGVGTLEQSLRTTIHGQNKGSVFIFNSGEGPETILRNLSIVAGQNQNASSGGGIHCVGSDPTLIGLELSDNTATLDGGGMYFLDSKAVIQGCRITSNSASRNGGGIFAENSALYICSNIICDNAPEQTYGCEHSLGGNNLIDEVCSGFSGGLQPCVPDMEGSIVTVFVLAGQSNMVGGANPIDLPTTLLPFIETNPMVVIRQWLNGSEYGNGQWNLLEPRGGQSFGPEMMLGKVLSMAQPSRNIAFMKIAFNGSNLACAWNPNGCGLNLYDTMINLVDDWKDELEALGATVRFGGFVWVQGEGDCATQWSAISYADNLTSLIAGVRTATGDPRLPVVVAKVSPIASGYPYVQIVHQGMDSVANEDADVATITCQAIEQKTDLIHYSASGMITLGAALGDTILGLDPFDLETQTWIGDMDSDGDVDTDDLDVLRTSLDLCASDTDMDGDTDIEDLLNVVAGWGNTCTP